MIQNKDIINCLPLLASVLGDRYGVEVRIGGYDACTNGKVIRIPALPVDCDKTALALAKGYIDHESAHIRHTDFDLIRQLGLDASTRYVFNAIEDWRVERRISAIYPGCRQNLDWLIRRFFVEEEDGRAGEKSPALAVLSYIVLTVRSWDVAEVNGPRTRTRAQVEKAYPGLAEKLDAVLDRVRHDCPDTAAALEAAKELVQIIRAFQPEEPAKEQQGGGGQKQNGKEQGDSNPPPHRPANLKSRKRRVAKSNRPPRPHLTARLTRMNMNRQRNRSSLTALILMARRRRMAIRKPAKEVMKPGLGRMKPMIWARSLMPWTRTACPGISGSALPGNSPA